jgi:yecA family protein
MQGSTSAALRSFLEHPSRPPDTLTYHELQGFLFSIACAPELVKPSEWMPMVFGEVDAGYATLEEAEAIITELMTLYNDVNAAVREGRAALPAGCQFRLHDLANLDDDAPVGQWSRGFLRGHQWLEETWDPYVPDEIDQDLAAMLMTLTFFASNTLAEAYFRRDRGQNRIRRRADDSRRVPRCAGSIRAPGPGDSTDPAGGGG